MLQKILLLKIVLLTFSITVYAGHKLTLNIEVDYHSLQALHQSFEGIHLGSSLAPIDSQKQEARVYTAIDEYADATTTIGFSGDPRLLPIIKGPDDPAIETTREATTESLSLNRNQTVYVRIRKDLVSGKIFLDKLIVEKGNQQTKEQEENLVKFLDHVQDRKKMILEALADISDSPDDIAESAAVLEEVIEYTMEFGQSSLKEVKQLNTTGVRESFSYPLDQTAGTWDDFLAGKEVKFKPSTESTGALEQYITGKMKTVFKENRLLEVIELAHFGGSLGEVELDQYVPPHSVEIIATGDSLRTSLSGAKVKGHVDIDLGILGDIAIEEHEDDIYGCDPLL